MQGSAPAPCCPACTWAVLLLLLTWPAQVAAQGDGLYGRFSDDGAMWVHVAGGRSDAPAGWAATADLRLRYLGALGLVVGGDWREDGRSRAWAGVELRPLFPTLFLQNASTGSELVDMTLQSLGVELGAALLPLGRGVGAALVVGVGMEIPVARPFFLRLALRHTRASPQDRATPGATADWVWTVGLAFRAAVRLGVAAREMR